MYLSRIHIVGYAVVDLILVQVRKVYSAATLSSSACMRECVYICLCVACSHLFVNNGDAFVCACTMRMMMSALYCLSTTCKIYWKSDAISWLDLCL